MVDVRMYEAGIKALGSSKEVVGQLRTAAEDVRGKVQLPSSHRLTLSTKAGIGPRGAFAQVIMSGSGALAVEFGSRRNAPLAPLRRALGAAPTGGVRPRPAAPRLGPRVTHNVGHRGGGGMGSSSGLGRRGDF